MSPQRPSAQRTKHERISHALRQQILGGDYGPGERLPTERELAERFQVHRMTIRQATETLIEAGLVFRQRPRGVFVRELEQAALTKHRITLVAPAAESAQVSSFVEHGVARAKSRQWYPRVVRTHAEDENFVASLVSGPEASIIMGLPCSAGSPLGQAARAAKDRAVLLGSRLDHEGIHSILADDELGIRMAIEHLAQRQHERIVLLCSTSDDHHPTLEIQVQRFHQAMMHLGLASDAPGRRIIRLPEVEIGGSAMAAYHAVQTYLQHAKPKPTAIIGLSEEVCHGAAAACHRLGLRVPDEVSLLAYAGTCRVELCVPPLSTIDVDVAAHVDLAIELIQRSNPAEDHKHLHIVRPKLVERASVAAAPA
ncbi:MAG: GntR family transcriptional regulator [Planctomycetota bacterium]